MKMCSSEFMINGWSNQAYKHTHMHSAVPLVWGSLKLTPITKYQCYIELHATVIAFSSWYFLFGQVFSQWTTYTTWQMKFWRWNTLTIPMWWPWLVCVWALEVDQPLSCLIWKMEVSWATSGKTRIISSWMMTKTLTQWATVHYSVVIDYETPFLQKM